jgi:hypothetical protein
VKRHPATDEVMQRHLGTTQSLTPGAARNRFPDSVFHQGAQRMQSLRRQNVIPTLGELGKQIRCIKLTKDLVQQRA